MIDINFNLNIIDLEEVSSTTDHLLSKIKSGAIEEGTVIMTQNQTNGRGRQGNTWESDPGENMIFSILLKPGFLESRQLFIINKLTSVAICDYLNQVLGPHQPVSIKWPNDIYVGDCKIAGILTETISQPDGSFEIIAGIGLNVNQEQFPDSLPNPTSMKLICGQKYNLKEEIKELLKCLVNRYIQLRYDKYNIIDGQYLKKLYKVNEASNYLYKNEKISAQIKDVLADGRLRLLSKGNTIDVTMNELQFL